LRNRDDELSILFAPIDLQVSCATEQLDATGRREAVPPSKGMRPHSHLKVLGKLKQPSCNMGASKRVLLIQARTFALGRFEMLWTIFVILLVLWLVGLVSSYTLGGFIHLLLVAAVVVLILQLISGRRTV
jgi:hypothetical protein